jgi:hypothetical protein
VQNTEASGRFDEGTRERVERLLARIEARTAERQHLRSCGASAEHLEHNRLAIVELQWELSRALIARHRPHRLAA